MMSLNYEEVLPTLKKGSLEMVYFLLGDDYFLQQHFVSKIEEVISDDGPVLREMLIPEDMGAQEIIARLTQADLFSSKKLYVLRNPQQIHHKARDELLQFCAQPLPNHYLIITMDDYNPKSVIMKSLQKMFTPIDVRKPFQNKLRSWTKYFFNEHHINAPPSVIEEVLAMSGDSVYHVANQIEKICLSLDGERVTPEFVRKFTGWNREYKMWEFLNAVGQKNLQKALFSGLDLITRSDFIALLPSLATLFQEMLFLKMDSGTSQPYTGYIPLTNGVRIKLASHANNYTKKEIEQTLLLLGKIDNNIKTTRISNESHLTRFIFNTLISNE